MHHTKQQNANPFPRLFVAAEAEDEEFDKVTLENWEAEGFNVTYLPFSIIQTHWECEMILQGFADTLDVGEEYAVIGPLLFPGAP